MSKTPAERKAAQRERDLKKINFVKDHHESIRSCLMMSITRSEGIIKECLELEDKRGVDMQRMINSAMECIAQTKKILDELEQVR